MVAEDPRVAFIHRREDTTGVIRRRDTPCASSS